MRPVSSPVSGPVSSPVSGPVSSPVSGYVRLARDTRGSVEGWLCGGLLAVVGLGMASPGLGHDVQRIAAAAGFAPAPVLSLWAE